MASLTRLASDDQHHEHADATAGHRGHVVGWNLHSRRQKEGSDGEDVRHDEETEYSHYRQHVSYLTDTTPTQLTGNASSPVASVNA
jgi:hypothetical protein